MREIRVNGTTFRMSDRTYDDVCEGARLAEERAATACACTALERILADNDPRNGGPATRLLKMVDQICNGCGGTRPATATNGGNDGT